jgi:hypothetical protein
VIAGAAGAGTLTGAAGTGALTGATGAGVLAGAAEVRAFFRGVLAAYFDRGKNSLIRISSSVDSDPLLSSFLKESFSGLMCRWVCLKETLPWPAGSFPFDWGRIWSCMALRPTLLSSWVSLRSSHKDDSSLIWAPCSWIFEPCSRTIWRRCEMSSWRSRRVEKIWGRGWSADRVGLRAGSTAWVELVAIVVGSSWDSIASSDQCCCVGRRSIFPLVDRFLAKSYSIGLWSCDPWCGLLVWE